MQLIITIAISIVLMVVFYEDYRYRAVTWFYFPLLLGLFILYSLPYIGLTELVKNTGINSLFFGFQLLVITVYFSIKHRRLVNITKEYLGIGDVLFVLVLACIFSPINFIAYYLLSLVAVVITVVMVQIFKGAFNKTIPLAGLQSLFILPIIFLNGSSGFTVFDDSFILQYLILS